MIIAIIGIIVIAGSMIYYFVFYIPGNEKAKQDKATADSVANQKALNDCLEQAKLNYDNAMIVINKSSHES